MRDCKTASVLPATRKTAQNRLETHPKITSEPISLTHVFLFVELNCLHPTPLSLSLSACPPIHHLADCNVAIGRRPCGLEYLSLVLRLSSSQNRCSSLPFPVSVKQLVTGLVETSIPCGPKVAHTLGTCTWFVSALV